MPKQQSDPYKLGDGQRKNLAQQAVKQIIRMIHDNSLGAGEKLPSEPELCQMLGVSRAVVREAIAGLCALGIVESRHGYGNFILDFSNHLIKPSMYYAETSPQSMREVLQVRRIFELEIARIAAINRTDEDIAQMELFNRKLCNKSNTLEQRVGYDLEFHMALANCTKNHVLHTIVLGLYDVLKLSRVEVLREHQSAKRAQDEHRLVLDAIIAGDPEGAVRAMEHHLAVVESHMLQES